MPDNQYAIDMSTLDLLHYWHNARTSYNPDGSKPMELYIFSLDLRDELFYRLHGELLPDCD